MLSIVVLFLYLFGMDGWTIDRREELRVSDCCRMHSVRTHDRGAREPKEAEIGAQLLDSAFKKHQNTKTPKHQNLCIVTVVVYLHLVG